MSRDPSRFDVLSEGDEEQLCSIVASLEQRKYAEEEVLFTQGDGATTFALVNGGQFEIVRTDDAVQRSWALVGPGSILGEMGVLRQRPRVATVICRQPGEVLLGDRTQLVALIETPGVLDRMQLLITTRLAEDTEPVLVATRDSAFAFRPLVPRDRDAFVAGLKALSNRSLYRRFFTGGQPSDRIVDRLLALDYIDHFAWAVMSPDSGQGVAVARYNRERSDRTIAEVAFAVADELHGRGLGTAMLGALAVAARTAGITRLRAEVLTDNAAMRAVLDKVGAIWEPVEPGVVETLVDVAACDRLVDGATAAALGESVTKIFTATNLGLTSSAPSPDNSTAPHPVTRHETST
ncbi:MAG: GNAT family N-acetyltransferase [Actinobacteria bacterium]|nr:GNAT family N-acetyltransferase [Actinomycetota bacterium]MCB9388180.1 GNAT family N-acetyltransferase [Acidimicrobiia bacterium]